MADISKIKLGSTTYNVKDGSAITDITRSGTTFTAIKRDGTTFTFTQQDNNSNTIPTIYCDTAAATAAKVGQLTNGALAKGYYILLIRYANTSATALTLNVNSTGAKAIMINGTASSTSNYTLPAGQYIIYYDAATTPYFHIRTDGKIPALIDSGSLTTTTITPVTKKTVVTSVTNRTVVTGGNTTDIPNVTSVGSAPTLGTPFTIPNITKKTVVTSASGATAAYSNGILTITDGSFGTGDSVTTGTAFTVPNVTSAGSAPTLGTAIAAYTSLSTDYSVTVSTGDSVTSGNAVTVVTNDVN